MSSCSLSFLYCSFSPSLLAASIFHFLTSDIKFSCFSFNKKSFVFYLSLFSTSMQTLSRKKESALLLLLLLFISKSPGGCAIYRPKARCLKCKILFPAYMKGWTNVRAIFSEPKFFGCIGN